MLYGNSNLIYKEKYLSVYISRKNITEDLIYSYGYMRKLFDIDFTLRLEGT